VTVHLRLLGGFELDGAGSPLRVSWATQRTLAFIALARRPIARSYIAGCLWGTSDEAHAHSSLRTALWRLGTIGPAIVASDRQTIALHPSVRVDVQEQELHARSILDGHWPASASGTHGVLMRDLLPEWYEDWVDAERERLRQLRLHALEAAAALLTEAGHHSAAIDLALAAVQGDSCRESAQRVLIAAHVAEGNISEAVRQFDRYSRNLHQRFGVPPSPELSSWVRVLVGRTEGTSRDAAVTKH
jgi:DNA-binding SARP family transcriptional activator